MFKMETTRRAFLKSSLLGIGAISLGATSAFKAFGQSTGYPNGHLLIEPDELSNSLAAAMSGCPVAMGILLDTLRIVDSRERELYDGDHILSAAHLGYPDVTEQRAGINGFVAQPEVAESRFTEIGLDNNIDVVLYSNQGAIWSSRLFWVLEYYGHTNVRMLNGGITRWTQEERGLTTDLPDLRSSSFRANINPSILVEADWIMENLENPDVVFVDARGASSYEAGHIPGAILRPWNENIDWDDESFLPYDELALQFTERGIAQDKIVICYCQSGVLSAQNFFVCRLLDYPDVRLYDGSWADWSSDPNRPIETGP